MILIDCRIGTPEATVPEKVRDQRASDDLLHDVADLEGDLQLDPIPLRAPALGLLPPEKPTITPTIAGSKMYQ